ncbi:hypothetical protein AWC03_17510 [Mycobacterium europaeum]|nr:hypothetical protein AWC03_17510 [Mycobacterium europaeum]
MGARAQRRAPEPDCATAAAVAAASAREQRRARRRRRAAIEDHYRGYEFVDLEPDPPEAAVSSVASDRGAGQLGFAGTASRAAADASGLATLAGDGFGGGPSLPMVPGNWAPD